MKSLFGKLFGNKKNVNSEANNFLNNDNNIKETLKNKGQVQFNVDVQSGKKYVVRLEKDDFNNNEIIKFKQVANFVKDKLITCDDEVSFFLNIGFSRENNQNFLTLDAYQKHIKFIPENKILFLFENKEILEFEINEKGVKIENDGDGVVCETKIPLSNINFNLFSASKVIKWRYLINDKQQITATLNSEVSNDFFDLFSVFKTVIEKNYF